MSKALPKKEYDKSAKGPLAGVRVLDLSRLVAGNTVTQLLGDFGAEVIKIEPPGGDPFRGWGAAVNGNSVWFSIHGRNKLSVELDLKKDRDTFLKLAARADVLVENMRAGARATNFDLRGELERAAASPAMVALILECTRRVPKERPRAADVYERVAAELALHAPE